MVIRTVPVTRNVADVEKATPATFKRLFDPAAWWKVEAAALRSQGKNTPFLGLEVQGRVKFTVVGGEVVFEA